MYDGKLKGLFSFLIETFRGGFLIFILNFPQLKKGFFRFSS